MTKKQLKKKYRMSDFEYDLCYLFSKYTPYSIGQIFEVYNDLKSMDRAFDVLLFSYKFNTLPGILSENLKEFWKQNE